jgi:hypothetical protein
MPNTFELIDLVENYNCLTECGYFSKLATRAELILAVSDSGTAPPPVAVGIVGNRGILGKLCSLMEIFYNFTNIFF